MEYVTEIQHALPKVERGKSLFRFSNYTKSSTLKNFIKSTWLFLSCTAIFFGLNLIENGSIPDFLNFRLVSPSNFYSLILGTTASVFGILVTVVLLAFQLLRKISLRQREENIVYNPNVTGFISLASFIIIFSAFAFIQTPTFETTASLTQAYFMLILFVAFILLLFPLSIFILNEIDTLKKARKGIAQLQLSHFAEMDRAKYEEGNFSSKEITKPLFKIRYEIVTAIRELDNVDLTIILEDLNEKSIELIGDGQYRKETDIVLSGLTNVWKHCHHEALRSNNLEYYSLIWDCILKQYENAANKKIPLLHTQQLSFYIWEYTNYLTRNKGADSLIAGISFLSDSFRVNLLNNCPDQEQISDLINLFEKKNVFFNQNENLQWDGITGILYHLKALHSSALSIPDKELYTSVTRELVQLLTEIIEGRIPNIKVYQEAYLVREIVSHLLYNSSLALEQGLCKDTDTYKFEGYTIAKIIINERFYTKHILRELSDFLIKSQRAGYLSTWPTINNWGAIPRHTSKYYKQNATVRKATAYIFETLKTMKNEIETHQWPGQVKNHKEIKKQIEALYRTLIEDGIPESDLTEINKTIESFKKETTGIPDFSIVKWDDTE